jgi:hypothetical protein
MCDSNDAKNSLLNPPKDYSKDHFKDDPCYWGLVETGRHNNGGINGSLDKYLC